MKLPVVIYEAEEGVLNQEILIMAEHMLGKGIKHFMKNDLVSAGPCVPNRGRRNITVNHLLLNRCGRCLPRPRGRGSRSREVLR